MTPNDPSDNPWSDLERPPLNAASLSRALVRPESLWTSLEVVDSTGSTNTDLAARAARGEAREGQVLVAERQTAGRGRLERTWTAPARSGLFLSAVLVPEVPAERWSWLPLLAGVATASALSRTAGADVVLKWPNDVLVRFGDEERKIGGILSERVERPGGPAAVVLGIGLNVTLREEELPVPGAGSLALAGARVTDRDTLLRAVLRSLQEWYGRWRDADGDPEASGVREAYTAGCATLGRRVRAVLPGERELLGEAVAVDDGGRLVLAGGEGVQQPVGAGDIVHLRPGPEGA
ncbi:MULTISPECIES: biotin--[acetyl-CoA-carboxylase] ligase [Streptomyces]|uniref:biotin--[biotin carboxyl-carrier protein] ligase n=1 Tax=Streptomyces radiopugnans TaxID=403935 RepID=A0A1H9HZM5_9ACTN|nr:biotin--[acetyl-CoA-carboxylase] ligase [Streptomyces radiopugnans]SEQ67748.1 BirA family transcriptional regulator, biotin operon repressor / biotin-[acetyl-CoA-carboxylase] ligase [Streptomyces radiopugnans]